MQLLQNLKISRKLLAFVVIASMALFVLPKQARAEVVKNQGVVNGPSITYTVQFNSNVNTDVSVSNMPSPVDVTYGVTVMPDAPTRNGCNFTGWNTSENGSGTDVDGSNFNCIPGVDDGETVVLYAQWSAIPNDSHWEASLKPHDGGTRPTNGTYSYYPGGDSPLSNISYDGAYDINSGLYYYATIGMAVEAAVAGPMTSDQAIDTSDPDKDILNPNIGSLTDVVTLLKDVGAVIYNFGKNPWVSYTYGISKGIVIDLQGHGSGGISSGQIPDDQVLIITNNSERVNAFTNPANNMYGYGEVDDETFDGTKTGTVILNNVTTNIIWGSLHRYIILSGNYSNIIKYGSDFDIDVRGGYFTEDPRYMSGINVSLTNSHVVKVENPEPVHADIYKNYIVLKGMTAYTVNFDANAGDDIVTGMPDNMTVEYGITSMPSNIPTRSGYKFIGWNTMANGNGTQVTEANFNELTNEHEATINVYAMWMIVHAHDDITFIPWESDNSLPTEAGSYFLTKDVTLSGTWEVPSGTTNLCLNGKVIKQTREGEDANTYGVICIFNAKLDLYDCDNYTTPHEGYVDNDSLWHYGVGEGTPKTIYGGIITGGFAIYGGGVSVQPGGEFNMHGGNIAGCKGSYGGGVSNKALATIKGGVIQYCATSCGGGLYLYDGTCEMSGGSIEHCTANNNSGGVLVDGSDFTLSGGTIANNVSKEAVIKVEENGVLNITGGSINDNTINGASTLYKFGCILLTDNAKLTMYGGTISGNTSSQNCGGVYADASSTIEIGGTAEITGNALNNGTTRNVYLPSGKYMTIADGDNAPQEGMSVGVTLGTTDGLGQFTTNGAASDTQYFFADDGGDTIVTCPGDYLALHVHGNLRYKGDANLLISQCGNEYCFATPLTYDTLTLTVVTPVTYDGNPYDGLTTTTTDGFEVLPNYTIDTVYYEGTADELGTISYDLDNPTPVVPTNAGYYLAQVRATESVTLKGGEGDTPSYAEAAFTILRVNYSGYDDTAECTLGARPGSTASFQLPDIPEGAAYGDVTNDNNFDVATNSNTVTLTTKTGGLPRVEEGGTFTFTVEVMDPEGNHNPYNITVTVTPDYPFGDIVEGVLYFYNAAAGKWLGVDNLHNGMKASLVDKPQPILVTDNGDYTYLLDAYIASSAGNGYLGLVSNECLMNCAEGAGVSFWPVNDNIYTVSDVNGHVFGYDGSGTLLSASATGENSHWTLLTRDDLISSLASATLASPKDATFLISDPQCGKDNRLFNEKWQGAGLEKAGSDGNAHASANTGGTGTFNAYQDLERGDELDIPNGIYELSVQGFYSSTSDKRCAYFYANNNTMALKNIASAEQQPTTEEEASAAFTDGKYQCNTIKIIVINHSIRIGVNGIYDECGWTAFDNFRLTYLGSTSQLNH